MTHPWFKFWPSNWLGDTQLRLCSQEARGLLIDMLSIMHTAKRRGHLETHMGKIIDDDMLSRLIGTNKGDVYRAKSELIECGIVSVDDEGVIYSRKMVKDEEKSNKCAKAGKRGGGNPALNEDATKKGTNKEEDRGYKIDDICPKVTFKGHGEAFSAFWAAWPKHPRKTNKTGCMKVWKAQKLDAKADAVMAGLEAWKGSESWAKDGGQFIPSTITWLRQERYADTEAATAKSGGKDSGLINTQYGNESKEIKEMNLDW